MCDKQYLNNAATVFYSTPHRLFLPEQGMARAIPGPPPLHTSLMNMGIKELRWQVSALSNLIYRRANIQKRAS
jgi:hypothetical protein